MALDGKLTIIAEKINDSVPATHKLFDAGDTDALIALAKTQAAEGAGYIDVNIGLRDKALMAELVTAIQNVTDLPLSIDSPSYEIAEAGLKAYDPAKAGGKNPVLNSISLSRLEMFDLLKVTPFKVILMASEHTVDGVATQNKKGEDVLAAAKEMHAIAKKHGLENDDIIFDPTIAPIGSDMEGLTRMTVEGITLIGKEPAFQGCHQSVGLSNFTVQIPSKTKSGDPVKTPLESAFLTLAVPKGLDFCIGNTKKKYEFLSDDHPALVTLKDVLTLDGFDVLTRVQEFYNA